MQSAIDRAGIVFGEDVGKKMRREAEEILGHVRGRADCLLAAIAKCEDDDFRPRKPIGFLIQVARGFAEEGIPDWIGEQLAKAPRPIGSGPPPSQTRPMHYWTAADMPKSEGPPIEGVAAEAKRIIREARRAALMGGPDL